MRKIAILFILTGAVAVAVIVVQRMSTDAMAVAIGVVVGVAASIPTSLLVVAATRAANREQYNTRYRDPQPPVVIIQQQPAPPQIAAPTLTPWEPRHWHDDGAQAVEATWTMIGE